MPTDKQIEAALESLRENPLSWEHPDAIRTALTAAEQYEPLANDVEVHRWQRATAVQSRKLQMVLYIPGVKERLQEITDSPDGYMLAGIEQAEPCKNPDCGCMFPRDCPSEPDWDGEPAPAAEQAQEAQPVAWLMNGKGDTWEERNVITFDHETAEMKASTEWWTVRPLYTSPVSSEGWQIVPIEPTREMLEAWIDDSSFPSSYRAMLAAAPKPEGNK